MQDDQFKQPKIGARNEPLLGLIHAISTSHFLEWEPTPWTFFVGELAVLALATVAAEEPWLTPKRTAVKHFSKAIGGVKSVEQLSQLFTAGHASGLERKHLGQMFYNKCFTALGGSPSIQTRSASKCVPARPTDSLARAAGSYFRGPAVRRLRLRPPGGLDAKRSV